MPQFKQRPFTDTTRHNTNYIINPRLYNVFDKTAQGAPWWNVLRMLFLTFSRSIILQNAPHDTFDRVLNIPMDTFDFSLAFNGHPISTDENEYIKNYEAI